MRSGEMTPDKWNKIKAIFNEAIDLGDEAREDFLRGHPDAESVAEARRLLEAETRERFSEPAARVSGLWAEDDAVEYEGREIGGFRLIREIGRGGMGIVFEAVRESDDFRQRAAVKILKLGADSAAMAKRFGRERQILATLEHANIARLLDGGRAADGTPFLAMEFVDGLPVDQFCDQNGLGLRDRLRLFLKICSAVAFAHSRLVIHRDLKPSNILVTDDSEVKLLDFGISKIVSPDDEMPDQTLTSLGMMTPRYASPEQAAGRIVSTPGDVYSLGLILYELLTGVPAHRFESSRPDGSHASFAIPSRRARPPRRRRPVRSFRTGDRTNRAEPRRPNRGAWPHHQSENAARRSRQHRPQGASERSGAPLLVGRAVRRRYRTLS
ncbi:MAG: serine/threonine protein kinase [Acidobacteria bacterium]|nr:serine/threonine protein kinase [Acidobacteriota bacterium]